MYKSRCQCIHCIEIEENKQINKENATNKLNKQVDTIVVIRKVTDLKAAKDASNPRIGKPMKELQLG